MLGCGIKWKYRCDQEVQEQVPGSSIHGKPLWQATCPGTRALRSNPHRGNWYCSERTGTEPRKGKAGVVGDETEGRERDGHRGTGGRSERQEDGTETTD